MCRLYTVSRLTNRGGRVVEVDRMRVFARNRELAMESARAKWGTACTISVTRVQAG